MAENEPSSPVVTVATSVSPSKIVTSTPMRPSTETRAPDSKVEPREERLSTSDRGRPAMIDANVGPGGAEPASKPDPRSPGTAERTPTPQKQTFVPTPAPVATTAMPESGAAKGSGDDS